MKLKTKVTTVEEVEVEVDGPIYYKRWGMYYCLCENSNIIYLSPDIMISVLGPAHSKWHTSFDIIDDGSSERITRDEFMQVYNSTLASFRKSLEPNELP